MLLLPFLLERIFFVSHVSEGPDFIMDGKKKRHQGATLPDSRLRPTPGFRFVFIVLWSVLLLGGLWSSASSVRAQSYPQRIISTSPSITEILFELGLGDRVVGVTNFCSYPQEACQLPRIGGLLNPNVEVWITLKSDLIIHQDDSHKLKANADNLRIRTLAVSLKSLDHIYTSIKTIGETMGVPANADRLIGKLQKGINDYQTRLAGIEKKSVLLLLGDVDEPGRELYAVGRKAFLGELLSLAGGENIMTDTLAEYPIISKEFIIHRSPEVIIEAGPKSKLTPEQQKRRMEEWSHYPTLRAVKNKNIKFIGANYILIPGPRLLKIVGHFARAVHPEIFTEPPLDVAAQKKDGGE